MKRNRKLAVVICICLILSLCLPFFLSGCRKKKIDSEMSVYYLNEDRTGLVKAPYETGKTAKGKKMTDKEICGMAEDILETLRKPSDKIENVPPIPNEVSVQKCELRGSILDIDFNKAYLKVNSLEEKLMRASIVCSLSEIEGVNAVLFTIDGESLKDSDGNSIGLMTEDDFVEKHRIVTERLPDGRINGFILQMKAEISLFRKKFRQGTAVICRKRK